MSVQVAFTESLSLIVNPDCQIRGHRFDSLVGQIIQISV